MEFRKVHKARVSFDNLDSQAFVPNNVPFGASKGTTVVEEGETFYSDEEDVDLRQVQERKNKKEQKKGKDESQSGDLDLKVVIAKRPVDRQRWLSRILKEAHDGKIKNRLSSLYDIISHRKFAAGLDDHQGRRMRHDILKRLGLFSAKQQQFLKSANWPMEKDFGGEVLKQTDSGGEGSAKPEQLSQQAGSVGFNFGAGSSKDTQAASAASTSAATAAATPSEVKSGGGVDTSAVLSMLQKTAAFQHTAPVEPKAAGVDTTAVLSMLQKTAAFAQGGRAPLVTKPLQATSAPSASGAGMNTSTASNVLPKTEAVASTVQQEVEGDRVHKSNVASSKSVDKAAEEPATSAARSESPSPKEQAPPKEKGIFLPEQRSAKLSQTEFDAKFAEKARSVSKMNPDHDSLSNIRAEVLAERGIARARSRSRRRERHQDQRDGGEIRRDRHQDQRDGGEMRRDRHQDQSDGGEIRRDRHQDQRDGGERRRDRHQDERDDVEIPAERGHARPRSRSRRRDRHHQDQRDKGEMVDQRLAERGLVRPRSRSRRRDRYQDQRDEGRTRYQ